MTLGSPQLRREGWECVQAWHNESAPDPADVVWASLRHVPLPPPAMIPLRGDFRTCMQRVILWRFAFLSALGTCI